MVACKCEVCTSTSKKDKRLRSSILVESETTSMVVDTTPDFRYQMLRENVQKLDAVLFTHPHKDHMAGLDDIRAYNYFQRKPMEIYCNKMTERALRTEFHYVFSKEKYPGIPSLNIHLIDKEDLFMVGDIPVQCVGVWHMRMPVLAFRFGHFTYITDANQVDEGEREKIRGSECCVINALRFEKHISHFSLPEAISLSQNLEIRDTYLTHISHQLGLHANVSRELPQGVHLAFDGLKLNFSEYLV